jgi:uncharacterized protein YcbK (DUF882 family)
MSTWTRRRWLQTVVAGSVSLPLARFVSAQDSSGQQAVASESPERFIQLLNTHTNETLGVVYKRGREYDHAALAKLKNLLRDHRNGEVHDMDPGLYDQLHDLALAADCDPHFEIISGYRSAESNAKMSSRPGSGVAKKSLHMDGRAVDVRLCRCSCSNLRDLALTAKRGGVGYYQRSDFVHIDTGTFRTWVG